jgi:tetratricopeptide (TPR) repeat protein
MTTRLALAITMIAAGLSGAQNQMPEMLRKGVVQEETGQNLNAAILTYQSVLAQFDEERKTAATALFRLAECYRKQGKNDQAIAAYQRVVREFADQGKLAEQSRSQLAGTFKIRPEQAESQVQEARRRYRTLLAAQIEMMAAQARREYELGKIDQGELRMQLLQMQRELAAFDAGISQPATTTSPRR